MFEFAMSLCMGRYSEEKSIGLEFAESIGTSAAFRCTECPAASFGLHRRNRTERADDLKNRLFNL